MNRPTDRGDRPPELDTAYARANQVDGTRPSASTRASILAQARRHAAGRAANDPLWNWRAVASVVGVAFAGVVSLWLYRGNPTPTPTLAAAPPSAPVVAATSESAETAGTAQALGQNSVSRMADSAALQAKSSIRVGAEAVTLAAPAAAPAPVAPVAVPVARSAQPVTPAAEVLLQRWFPQALDSDAEGQQYWFLLDPGGAVLGSGQRSWRELAALQAELRDGIAPRRIARIESVHVANRRGRDVEVAYAWAAAD